MLWECHLWMPSQISVTNVIANTVMNTVLNIVLNIIYECCLKCTSKKCQSVFFNFGNYLLKGFSRLARCFVYYMTCRVSAKKCLVSTWCHQAHALFRHSQGLCHHFCQRVLRPSGWDECQEISSLHVCGFCSDRVKKVLGSTYLKTVLDLSWHRKSVQNFCGFLWHFNSCWFSLFQTSSQFHLF